MKKLTHKGNQKGFTIIEVLIVLAIAGLIMVVVFLAVPSLQRSGRNNAYNTNANNVLAGINNYMSNNNGVLPGEVSLASNVVTMKLTSSSTTDNQETVKVDTGLTAAGLSTTIPTTKPAPGALVVVTKATCSGNTPVASTAGRAVVVYYGAESGSGDIAKCIGS